jgi:hypothetical protein
MMTNLGREPALDHGAYRGPRFVGTGRRLGMGTQDQNGTPLLRAGLTRT